jgi:hypothetical protein
MSKQLIRASYEFEPAIPFHTSSQGQQMWSDCNRLQEVKNAQSLLEHNTLTSSSQPSSGDRLRFSSPGL